MKHFYFFLYIIILSHHVFITAQTFAEPPGPENVLVVFKYGSIISENIMSHYVDVREIPSTNIIGIDLKNPSDYGVEIIQEGEEINALASKEAGWIYVKEVIADTLEYYLNNTYYNNQLLKDIVRYLVICKGLPLKVRYADTLGWNWRAGYRNRVSVDALLCLINQPSGWDITHLFETTKSSFNNPYFEADSRFSMDYRFVSNYFVNQHGWYLQYLVSRLDGDNYEDVIALIDSSMNPDMSGNKYWIIDDDPEPDDPIIPGCLLGETHSRLKQLGFNLK